MCFRVLEECSVPSEKDIMEFCRERLPHFMAPKTVVFTEELPKTSNTEVRVTRNCHVDGLSRLRLDELCCFIFIFFISSCVVNN